jgi:hypothetical protein
MTNFCNHFKLFKYCILLGVILLSPNAYCDLHLEPSYSLLNGQFDDAQDKGNFTANVYGLKVGYIGQNIYIGMNFEVGDYDFDNDFSTFNTSSYKGGGVGSYIGFYTGWFRIWTSYLNSSLEPQSNRDNRYFGQQFNYGIGFKIGGSFFINYEVFANSYTQIENDQTGRTDALSQHIRTEGYSLSLAIQWAIF